MSKDVNKLRERAEAGKLTDEDRAYLAQREGINAFDHIRSMSDEPVFDEEDEDVSYEDMSNDDLRAELESRGLATSGNKAELIERLNESDDEE